MPRKHNILISCPISQFEQEKLREQLKYFELHFCTREESEFHNILSKADVIVDWQFSKREVALATSLELFHVWGIGVDKIAIDEFGQNIVVRKAQNTAATSIAEYVLLQVLLWERDLLSWNRKGKRGNWTWEQRNNFFFRELSEINLLIIGMGPIGRATANLLSSLGTKVRGITRSKEKHIHSPCFESVGDFKQMHDFGSQCDYVSVHLPRTRDTDQLIDKEFLARLQPKAILINTSRGSVMQENDLLNCLKDSGIRGASLDVLQKEPLSHENDFSRLDNVVITCHQSGRSFNAVSHMCETIASNIRAYYN